MQVKTLNQILKLRLKVSGYVITMVDWFEIHLYPGSILIKNGLRHADGETRSPYYYEENTFGKGYKKRALEKFNEFLKKVTEDDE
jgi:hypothetical protein